MILTIDSGTSVTKVAIWDRSGLAGLSGARLDTRHPAGGRAEQDPTSWWTSVLSAGQELDRRLPGVLESVEVVGCTGARQTFAPVDQGGNPTGPGILWSDRRAGSEAEELAARTGAEPGAPSAAGIVLDGASVAAKLRWLADHQPGTLDSAAWLLTPRDLVVRHLTGVVATDVTMASRSGLYDMEGTLVEGLAGPAASKLPPVVAPDHLVGSLCPDVATAMHLPAGIPVVIGAGDRACEVLGAHASATAPMVSWGTTANVSLPVTARPVPPPGLVASRAADGGWLLEGGLSAAGALLAWLSHLTGLTADDLAAAAEGSPPGARGVVAAPWLDGARAPWWRPEAAAAFVGLGPAHGSADLARALFEAVGWDLARCLEAMADCPGGGPPVVELVMAGSGAGPGVWLDVLTGITGLAVSYRRSGQAASAGAARLAAAAMGLEWELDEADPIVQRVEPDGERTRRYRGLRPRADAVAATLVDLDLDLDIDLDVDPGPVGEVPCD